MPRPAQPMYGVRLVPAVDSSVGATDFAASEAAREARFTHVPLEQTCPALQSESFLHEAACAGALASSAAPSVTAETNFQIIRSSLSARGSRLPATHRRSVAKLQF